MQTIGLHFSIDFTAAEVVKESDKAVCVRPVCGDKKGRMFWLPKSQMVESGKTQHPEGECVHYTLKNWIVKQLQAKFSNQFGYSDYTALFQP